MREIALEIAGLGIILYSPPAVAHIAEGSDDLQEHFSRPDDVARHVTACELTAFCTGSPGSFLLRFLDGSPDERDVQTADFKLRLGLWVQGGTICLRDLWGDDQVISINLESVASKPTLRWEGVPQLCEMDAG